MTHEKDTSFFFFTAAAFAARSRTTIPIFGWWREKRRSWKNVERKRFGAFGKKMYEIHRRIAVIDVHIEQEAASPDLRLTFCCHSCDLFSSTDSPTAALHHVVAAQSASPAWAAWQQWHKLNGSSSHSGFPHRRLHSLHGGKSVALWFLKAPPTSSQPSVILWNSNATARQQSEPARTG